MHRMALRLATAKSPAQPAQSVVFIFTFYVYTGIDVYILADILAASNRARAFWHQCVSWLTGRGLWECRSIRQKFMPGTAT